MIRNNNISRNIFRNQSYNHPFKDDLYMDDFEISIYLYFYKFTIPPFLSFIYINFQV